ncbi:helix-turn-helix domain-containing protein [Scytonema sp. UIC 10036]|uniref:AraC-like transcriptional regulator QhpR n=1 Tax=Scytonema sp. UIC 10036 TaxID=2304196 RepID=UPI0012DACC51|nr:AraC family transcriptional regulator [Scytonema sp. UIC 10036]MUG96123.1 helix-turn-helix domain-containing protein [Scytonema sp. UIC 10036]
MTMPPMIAMEFVVNAIQRAVQLGIEQQVILKIAGLTIEDIANQTKYFSLHQHIQLLEKLAVLNQDDFFGLHYGFTHHVSNFGILGYVLLNSATVGSALNSLVQYFGVWQQGTEIALTLDGNTAWLSYQVTDARISVRKQDAETAIAFAINSIRTLTRQHWYPKTVWLEHNSSKKALEYEQVLNAPVLFNQSINAIAMERELLKQKVPFADLSLLPILESRLHQFFVEKEVDDELVTLVNRAIARSLPQGCLTVGDIAFSLGLSSRTLQRYLSDRNTTYKQLVDKTRYQLSLMYLKEPEFSLTEVALLLGYSELSAFNHAFRRWTGLTPNKYRHSIGVESKVIARL